MPSLASGFEYDIFISYRHNDNRGGWVTEFVNALQEELAATIKEPLSIYFDKNPHDGLLETHNVDKSLEGKLKCLIFIPIISQTYCDTKSFAWQHEFVAFNKLTKEDPFGRDVKLSNGNVASRVLPIKIHDLDAEDKSLLESEMGGVLRAIEFIFKSSGVNRPLASSDKREENLNKTLYRDQINKVANAVKEIVTALKNPSVQSTRTTTNEQRTTKPKPYRKTLITSLAFLCLIAICYFFYQQRFTNNQQPTIDKSIAVLPFIDMSKEQDLQYLGDGVAEEIINVLAQTNDLKVIARSSLFQFKGKNEDLREIGKKLGVSTILEGSIRKSQGVVRVTAQLINVADGSHYWSKSMDQRTENLFEIQDAIANEVASSLKASLLQGITSKLKNGWNEEAQKLYQQGRFFYDRSGEGDMNQAAVLFERSIAIDSSQAIVLAYLSACYGTMPNSDLRNLYADKAMKVDSSVADVLAVVGIMYTDDLQFEKAYDNILRSLKNGKLSPLVLRCATYFSLNCGFPKQAVTIARKALDVDPLIGRSYLALNQALWVANDYPELLVSSKKAVEMFPNNETLHEWYARALITNKHFGEGDQEIKVIKAEDSKRRLLALLYFEQSNRHKLDSILNRMELNKIEGIEKVEIFAIRGESKNMWNTLETIKIDMSSLFQLRSGPIFEELRDTEKYKNFISRYNFPKPLVY